MVECWEVVILVSRTSALINKWGQKLEFLLRQVLHSLQQQRTVYKHCTKAAAGIDSHHSWPLEFGSFLSFLPADLRERFFLFDFVIFSISISFLVCASSSHWALWTPASWTEGSSEVGLYWCDSRQAGICLLGAALTWRGPDFAYLCMKGKGKGSRCTLRDDWDWPEVIKHLKKGLICPLTMKWMNVEWCLPQQLHNDISSQLRILDSWQPECILLMSHKCVYYMEMWWI